MHKQAPVLASAFKHATLATLGGEVFGFFFGFWVLSMDYRMFFLAAVFAWLPIVIVAYRRPEKPTGADRIIMFGSFPALFIALHTLSIYTRIQ